MAGCKAVPAHETVTLAKGKRLPYKLSRTMHMQVLELWATEKKAFDVLLDKYKSDAKRRRKARAKGSKGASTREVQIKHWAPRGQQLRDHERAWLATPRTVQVP